MELARDLYLGALHLLAFWGLVDLYCAYRFARSPVVDSTAALWNWAQSKWKLAMRPHTFLKVLPWIRHDLGEQQDPETQDGKIT